MPKGQFVFTVTPTVIGDATAGKELREAINLFWNAYLHLNISEYLNCFTADAIRLSGRAGGRQAGRTAIQAGLAAEWEAFERPNQVLAEKMTVERADFRIAGNYATATYWLGIDGGERWEYTDQGLVFQVFVKQGEHWLVVHHTDAWSLDYNVSAQQPGPGSTLDFDFAYPVQDLARAIKFYTPLLGAPEATSASRAYFNLKGGRFILDSSTWGGVTPVRKKLPNGYALFQVADVEPTVARLQAAGVKFSGTPQKNGADTYGVGFDLDGNVFVLWEKNFKSAAMTQAPVVSGFPAEGALAQKLAQAWLRCDAAALLSLYAPAGTWFDDTRLKERGLERDIIHALKTHYWPRYDQGPGGLAAQLEAKNFHARACGELLILSYDLSLSGRGAHPFRDSAWVTLAVNQAGKIIHTFVVDNNRSTAPVLELDYTGYPVKDVKLARQFYHKTIGLGEGYADEGYYGFWSNHAVFGIYETDVTEDKIPQPRQANGYMSFWVRSAQETYNYLKKSGCHFPVIPAINDKSGPDEQPGYTQVVATDSEGSVIIFTEYSGRPR